MRLLPLLATAASLLGFAAAKPEAYPDTDSFDVAGRFGKRAPINNLQARELCNGSIVLDPTTQSYDIASGDTLTKISVKFNRGICDIAKANNITNPDFILAGAKITIPPQVCYPDNHSCLNVPTPIRTCIDGGPGFFIVTSGDSLGAIARSFNITLEAIVGANKANIPNPDLIVPGQIVNVPICQNSLADLSAYIIKPQDTFYHLGLRYRSTEGQIRAVNPGVSPNSLQIGQVITLVSAARKIAGTEPANEL